ncbi:MAG TPA: insulinase family protein [Opitutaceae bacterium]|nr:insulinase family protein [Opitutaceae bacterium]
MRRFISLLAVALFTCGLRAALPFPQAESDLKPDPEARFGTLPNGVRYVVRANREPKQRASLRLLVLAGSLDENENQRGLAHFLEHMAFNGSAHYAPGTLVEFLQRMGMSFGADTNASTDFQRTLYLLELPDTKDTTLAEGMRVFADYAGGLLLKPEEIDKERGIILSEKRTRDDVGYRTFVARYGFTLAGSLFPQRFPIGETPVIEQAQRDRFADFYNAWYRPELMTVIVVGDIDPAAVEKQITAAFAPLTARAPERPAPDLGHLAPHDGVRVFYHAEPEAPNTQVTIATVTPYTHEPDTAANRLKYLPRELAHAMINRRLTILAKKENAPFTSARSGVGEAYNFYRESTMSLTCRADQWAAALGVGDQELRRALEHGFQEPELKEVVADFRNSLEQAVKTAPTRHSDALADEIADTLVEREVFTSPGDDLAVYGPALERVTVDDCLRALRDTWSPAQRLVMVTGNARIDPSSASAAAGASSGVAEQAIASVYEKSRAVAVAPPEKIADTQWAYTDFGAPGKIAQRQHVDDLDLTLVRFENGVRLNLKKTDFEANRIRLNVRVGTGQLTEPRDEPGLATYTSQTFSAGGLGKHSVDDLRRILAGKTVGAGFGAAGDAFTASGATNREDLLLELQLVTAYLTDPGFRPEAARQMRKGIDQLYLSFAHTPSGPFNLEVPKIISSGDSRFGFPPKEEMLKRTLDEARAWIAPQLQHGAIEIALVGDLDIDATIDAVAKTLGALPPREPKPALDELRQVKFPAEPFAREFKIDSEIPKGVVVTYWPATDSREIHRTRRLNLLTEVLTDRLRLKVREELGDAYSPGAGPSLSDIYPGYGYLTANVTVDPPKAKQIADLLVQIGNDLAEKGVTDDELERAKKPVLTALREDARTNQYWLGSVLARAQERPEMLDWCRSRYSDNESITTADLAALAKTYLPAARASRVIVVPIAPARAASTGPTPPVAPAGK